MIINPENYFLILIGIIWIVGGVLQDLKRREVDNLWNFSLIAVAFTYRLVVSVYNNDYWFILNGLLGFVIFLGLGNLFYYSRLFAGGDAKMLISLGVILPLSYEWMGNFKIFGIFLVASFVGGSIYSLIWVLCLMIRNFNKFKKDFSRNAKKYKKLFLISMIFCILWVIFVLIISEIFLLSLAFIILLFPVLFVLAKSVEEGSMVKLVNPLQVTEGDWLYRDIIVNGKRIKANWEGVSREELRLIQKNYKKKVLIKYGIPFTPAFLIGFLILLGLIWKGFWV
ncbi:MAG: prepilin peptidase [Candidatus Nanoarchaeia archaeon]|nr:prepilin peptidase [Candidatus Nanoarchaeia archaeon]